MFGGRGKRGELLLNSIPQQPWLQPQSLFRLAILVDTHLYVWSHLLLAMSQRKATAAEVSLVHLKNCLVNLPSSLVSLLVNVDTVRLEPVTLPYGPACRLMFPCLPARSKCRRRAQLPEHPSRRGRQSCRRIGPEIGIPRMDWHAQQEEACGDSRTRWDQWLEKRIGPARAGCAPC